MVHYARVKADAPALAPQISDCKRIGEALDQPLPHPHHHRIRSTQVLHARLAEARFAHPARAVGPRVVKPAAGFDEHVEAHEQAKSVLLALVIDNGLEDDQRAAWRQGGMGFGQEHLLGFQVPVVQDVAHDDDVGLGERVLKKVQLGEFEPISEAMGGDIFLEDRPDDFQVGAQAC